jgi:cardiolipin synthase A/B
MFKAKIRIAGPFSAICLAILIFNLPGCATLPQVSQMIGEVPVAAEPPQITLTEGLSSSEESSSLIENQKSLGESADLLQRHIAVMESVTKSLLIKGNRVTLLVDGPAVYDAMFKAILDARDHVNLETFTFDADETGRKFADLLLLKHSEGVRVNLIYDSAGSFKTPASFFQRLRDGGIQVVEFNPLNPIKTDLKWSPTHRDHRKILIVDGKVVVTGGLNISHVYSISAFGTGKGEGSAWRDTDVRIEGPAVTEFQRLFLRTWQTQKGPELLGQNYFPALKEEGKDLVQVAGSTHGQMNRATFVLYVSALTYAEKTVHIMNAYFVPDSQIMRALIDGARRGADVKIILPRKGRHSLALYAGQYNYSDLLKSGVKLFERRNAMLHAKTAVIDGVWSTVGSTNMDYLSLLSNDEVNTVILSREFAAEMENVFDRDLAESDQVQWEEWKDRPLLPRVREWFAHLFARWL